jgi:hypothetical protein
VDETRSGPQAGRAVREAEHVDGAREQKLPLPGNLKSSVRMIASASSPIVSEQRNGPQAPVSDRHNHLGAPWDASLEALRPGVLELALDASSVLPPADADRDFWLVGVGARNVLRYRLEVLEGPVTFEHPHHLSSFLVEPGFELIPVANGTFKLGDLRLEMEAAMLENRLVKGLNLIVGRSTRPGSTTPISP